MKTQVLAPEYVEQLPEVLREGVLYISKPFALTAHKCCCGCGEDVYNKLSPVKWSIEERHGTVSLYPSVGNWNYACRSHYWIRSNRVIDAGPMSARKVKAVQRRDRRDRDRYVAQLNADAEGGVRPSNGLWQRVRAIVATPLRRLKAFLRL